MQFNVPAALGSNLVQQAPSVLHSRIIPILQRIQATSRISQQTLVREDSPTVRSNNMA